MPVNSILDINTIHEISKDNSFCIENFCFGQSKFDLCSIYKEIVQEFSVRVVVESITKDSLILVDPKSDEMAIDSCVFVVGRYNTLENLRDITKVESVVRFAWDWLQWTIKYLIVYF